MPGGTLTLLQAKLYLDVTCTTLVGSSVACGMCCCHLYYCTCFTGHVAATLTFAGATSSLKSLYYQMVVHYNCLIMSEAEVV